MKFTRLISLGLLALVSGCNDNAKDEEAGTTYKVLDTYEEDAHASRDENHPDAKVIQQLIKAGSDLSKPHTPDFQFDFKELEDARAVAGALKADGFATKIYAPQEGYPTYELIAQKEMIIEFATMADLTDRLRALAAENHGEMTGWGTPVEQ